MVVRFTRSTNRCFPTFADWINPVGRGSCVDWRPVACRIHYPKSPEQILQGGFQVRKAKLKSFVQQAFGDYVASVEHKFWIGPQNQWSADADHPRKSW